MGKNRSMKRKKIIDTKEAFYYLDPLKKIPEEYWNQEIWIQVPDKCSVIQKDAHKRLRDFLNERFILYQLGLDEKIVEMTQREVWYYIEILEERDNMVMDTIYKPSFVKEIGNYCKRIQEYVNVEYWGYVLDTLKIKTKARATVYEEVDLEWVPIGLDKNTLKNYADAPFFLVLCEKEDTITAFLKEIIKKGYNKNHFHCLNLEGESSTNVIRLLRKYIPVKNFHCFILHDMDISGLGIFFDMKRHFNCISIGINPDFLKYCNYDFNQLCENYKNKKGKTLKRVSMTMEEQVRTVLNEVDISIEEKQRYNSWIEMCIEKRIELNSITAHKIENNPSVSKVTDFIDYFTYILEQEKWDLTRKRELRKNGYSKITTKEKISKYQTQITTGYREWSIKPKLDILQVKQPEFIGIVKKKGEEIFTEESKTFLKKINEIVDLSWSFYSQVTDIFDPIKEKEKTNRNQKIHDFIEENRYLFDIKWNNFIKDKKETMKYNVRLIKRHLKLRCSRKYFITRRKLMNHEGYVKVPEAKVEKVEEKMGNRVYNYGFNENKKIIELKKELEEKLKETNKYNEAKEEAYKLTEKLDKLEIKKDKRVEILDNFKKKIEDVFTELIDDLNELNNEINN
ncbi:MAG: hypothetical protein ACFFDF_25435 [Candidatus Odinarchaeota archaeon]